MGNVSEREGWLLWLWAAGMTFVDALLHRIVLWRLKERTWTWRCNARNREEAKTYAINALIWLFLAGMAAMFALCL